MLWLIIFQLKNDEKDKRKSTADNVVTTQPSGVEYVNELKEENINLKEQVKNLTFDNDTVNIVFIEENINLKEQVKNLSIDNDTVNIKLHKLEEKLKGFTSQLVVKRRKWSILKRGMRDYPVKTLH